MARYSTLLGKRVQVHYRAGEVNLPASGILAADSGRSIFLEEHFVKDKRARSYRWEIPYEYIVSILELETSAPAGASGDKFPEVA